MAKATLNKSESILVHCLAGVHRGPMLGALLLGCFTGTTLDLALDKIGAVRAIEPHKVRSRKGGDAIFDWVREQIVRVLPSVQLPVEWSWRCSRRSGSFWHIVHKQGDERPVCRWRQAEARSYFKGSTMVASTSTEALVYGRRFCHNCCTLLPASERLLVANQISTV